MTESQRPKFDGTINLGHIITASSMGLAMITMFVNFKVNEANHEARITSLEEYRKESRDLSKVMADTQGVATRNMDRMTFLIDQMMTKKPQQP